MFRSIRESNTNLTLLITITVWIVLAILFGFTDLEISRAVWNKNSSWGIFGKEFGEIPGYGLIAIAISALIGSYNDDIKKQKIPAYVIIIIGVILFVFGIIFNSQDLIIDGGSIFICVIVFLAITFHKDWRAYRKVSAIITILAVTNPLVFVQIVKILCGRIRFVDLASGFTDYTPWFLPPGPISDGRSFPSGHTAMGFMFIPVLIVVKDYKWANPIKISISILTLGWAVFVGLSRIVIGAHYASDVLFSGGMAIVITLLLYQKFYGKIK